jgi:hypothetical protein
VGKSAAVFVHVLNQTTGDWHPCLVTLSATKGLNSRFFAPLRMTMLVGHIVKCTNVVWSDLVHHDDFADFMTIMPVQVGIQGGRETER